MAGADEAEFLELLVANNRIGDWVDRIRARGNPARQKQALLLLQRAVEGRSAYAEEARQAGVVPLLTRLLGLTGSQPPEDQVLAGRWLADSVFSHSPPRARARAHLANLLSLALPIPALPIP
ncbi:hypothetical protein Vretimale_4936 [Volvox reticuliferus]|uniref:Uncharacterized protein n=1 Tax=Volvox reticuliferus TaxID=1737510 RepID=A0A8J4G1Y0_9CHLO|nr:hypothetical protein Vretifemale_4142 [Volvox reticuliferus]GIL99887.1 hypothetical protein Vretimale_4936 [Volvox reticuliferus]